MKVIASQYRVPAEFRRTLLVWAAAAVGLSPAACIKLDVPSGDSLFPEASFIISGVMQEVDRDRPQCSQFLGDNGVIYHLFQGPRLTNDEFDELQEEGARVRLEIEIRDDLELLTCAVGKTVEVIEVLEFIPP